VDHPMWSRCSCLDNRNNGKLCHQVPHGGSSTGHFFRVGTVVWEAAQVSYRVAKFKTTYPARLQTRRAFLSLMLLGTGRELRYRTA
jgi:hypothetical protein